MASLSLVDLGFAEVPSRKSTLLNYLFPSKLGGPPAWLSLAQLPCFNRLQCENCLQTCKFLLQIYSPGGGDDDSSDDVGDEESDYDDSPSFHRTLFIFVCTANGCKKRSIKCFRSQLSRKNQFYDFNPPDYNNSSSTSCDINPNSLATTYGKLCQVCSCAATKFCSQCKKCSYCSKEHQTLHWKSGHKEECVAGGNTTTIGKGRHTFTFIS